MAHKVQLIWILLHFKSQHFSYYVLTPALWVHQWSGMRVSCGHRPCPPASRNLCPGPWGAPTCATPADELLPTFFSIRVGPERGGKTVTSHDVEMQGTAVLNALTMMENGSFFLHYTQLNNCSLHKVNCGSKASEGATSRT